MKTNKLKEKWDKECEEVMKPNQIEKERIIVFCSRCGTKFCKLGRVLEWGKIYPAVIIKVKGKKPKEIPADHEIKKAVCKKCAKELFDSEYFSTYRTQVEKKTIEKAEKNY